MSCRRYDHLGFAEAARLLGTAGKNAGVRGMTAMCWPTLTSRSRSAPGTTSILSLLSGLRPIAIHPAEFAKRPWISQIPSALTVRPLYRPVDPFLTRCALCLVGGCAFRVGAVIDFQCAAPMSTGVGVVAFDEVAGSS